MKLVCKLIFVDFIHKTANTNDKTGVSISRCSQAWLEPDVKNYAISILYCR